MRSSSVVFHARLPIWILAAALPYGPTSIVRQAQSGRDRLSQLIPRTHNTRVTAVTTRNAALGPRAIRLRQTTAASIEQTIPFLDDFQHMTTSLTGVSGERWLVSDTEEVRLKGRHAVRRYVGLARGHVTELASRISIGEYFQWLDQAEKRLFGRRRASALFDRYAQLLPGVPDAPEPRNILLDLEEAREIYETVPNLDGLRAGERLELEDACADCEASEPGKPRRFTVKGPWARI